MPHDTDTERTVLATLMRYNALYATVADGIDEGVFYYDLERAVFRAIAGTIASGSITDVNSLADYAAHHDVGYRLSRNDFKQVQQLPSRATFAQDVERLRTMARQREAWTLLQQAATAVVDPMRDFAETLGEASAALDRLHEKATESGISSFADAFAELDGVVQDNLDNNKAALETGFKLFDDKSLLRPGTLTVIAAFTSVGKSALSLNIAVNVAGKGDPVAYYSLEMGKAELAARAISEATMISAHILTTKPLTKPQVEAYQAARAAYARLPIYIDERSTTTFDGTMASIRTMAKKHGVKLVIIDYLQIYTQTADNVEASLAQMARQAKNIARETGTAVVLLSQLNRSGTKPALNMMRGSGQIEESADNIVLIDRPKAYDTSDTGDIQDAKLILAKGRGVGTGEKDVNFYKFTTTFKDKYTPADEEPEAAEGDQLPF